MKLIAKVGSLFSTRPIKRKPTKSISNNDPPSFGSSSTSSSSSSLPSSSSPRTVLPRDHKVTRQELEHVLRRLGGSDPLPLTEEEEEDVVSMVAEEMLMRLEEGVSGSIEELRDAFRVFDENGDGKISAEELRGVFAILEEDGDCGIDECRRMIESVDSDGDGLVCFDDFVKMMKGQRF